MPWQGTENDPADAAEGQHDWQEITNTVFVKVADADGNPVEQAIGRIESLLGGPCVPNPDPIVVQYSGSYEMRTSQQRLDCVWGWGITAEGAQAFACIPSHAPIDDETVVRFKVTGGTRARKHAHAY